MKIYCRAIITGTNTIYNVNCISTLLYLTYITSMSKLPAYLRKLPERQQLAVELLAANPGIKTKEAADALKISPEAVQAYRRKAEFNDAVYNRYMDITGGKMVNVVASMIREAEKGNVQAASLVLKHFGKLEDKITIRIESPFEKFLKIGNIDDFEEAEVVEDLTPEEIGASFVTDVELPERDPINDNLITRKKRENKKLKDAVNFKEDKRLKRRNSAYILRRRAERVGLDPLAPGRQRKNVRDNWIRELKNREKLMNIE